MNDLQRLKEEYANRQARFAHHNIYSWFNAANLFMIQQRQRALLSALKRQGIQDLSDKKILEMGCGAGGVLAEFLSFGAMPKNLYGLDILPERLREARQRLPASHLLNAEGSRIPFPACSFDIVLQFTALSSILDDKLRMEIAKDMRRALKPNGVIIWYDFWLNPTNPQTHGIRLNEIRGLFPEGVIHARKITLAPPITRRLAPISWMLAFMLEKMTLFNSHYLALIAYPKP